MPFSRNASFRTWGDVLNFLTPFYRKCSADLRLAGKVVGIYSDTIETNRNYALSIQREIRGMLELNETRLEGRKIPKTTRLPVEAILLAEELKQRLI